MVILKMISRYRTAYMGIATLLVIYYHMPYSPGFLSQVGQVIKNRCFFGVDIFMFLSGFGLYYSYLHDSNKLNYYTKRIRRIFPSFFVVTILFSLYQKDSICVIFSKLSTLGYWIGYPYVSWYISAILMFYLLFPFYIEQFNKNPIVVSIVTIFLGILTTIPVYLVFNDLRIGFFSRISIFSLGILCGYLSKTKTIRLTGHELWLVNIALIIFGAVSGFALKHFIPKYIDAWNPLPFIFITPSILIVLAVIFDCHYLRAINIYVIKYLEFIGLLSLEIYVIHEPLMSLFKIHPTTYGFFILEFFVVLVVSVVSALYLKKFINLIFR
jgi:peptidoglycan/LPS O-acetylase OafA/YrhL